MECYWAHEVQNALRLIFIPLLVGWDHISDIARMAGDEFFKVNDHYGIALFVLVTAMEQSVGIMRVVRERHLPHGAFA